MPGSRQIGRLFYVGVYACMYVFLGLNPGLCTCKSNTLALMYTFSSEKETVHSAENPNSEWEETDCMETGRHTQKSPMYLLKRNNRCSNGGNQRETQEKLFMAEYASQNMSAWDQTIIPQNAPGRGTIRYSKYAPLTRGLFWELTDTKRICLLVFMYKSPTGCGPEI